MNCRATPWAPLALISLALASSAACRRTVAPVTRDQPAVVVVESDEEDETTPAAAEREPNDDPLQAQPLRVGQPVSGTLTRHGRADRDWYAIEVDRPLQVARLQLGPVTGQDVTLELFAAPKQRLFAADNAGPGVAEVLPNLALEVGRYLVRVRARRATTGRPGGLHKAASGVVHQAAPRAAADATPAPVSTAAGRYRLSFTLRDRGEQEELEPNDTIERATELRFGETSGEAVGYCGGRGDVDWYRLAPRAWPVDRLLRVAADGLDGVRFELSWRDEAGQVIAQRQARANEGADLPHLRPPVAASGATVTIDCRSGYDVEVPYVLRLGWQAAAETELEPNDRVDQATTLADGQPLGGLLADRQDVDSYRIPVAQAGTLRVELTPPALLDLALQLVDDAGHPIASSDGGGAGQGELLSELPVSPPQALVQVRLGAQARRGDPTARYRIRALLQPAGPALGEASAEPLGPPPGPPP